MRNSRVFLFLALISVFGVNVLVLFMAFWFARSSRVSRQDLRDEIQGQLGIALTNIVDRIMLDVGIKGSSPSVSSSPISKRSIEFVPAEIKTFEEMAWINGKVFHKGDIISPYGVIMSIGKDCVALALPDSEKSYVIAPPLPVVEVKKEEGGSGGGQLAGASPASNPATPTPLPVSSSSKDG